jgi:hypothetical protein
VRDTLVEALSRDYGGHPYGKWRGAFWRLMSLVDLRVDPGHPGAVAAARESLDWIASPRRLATIHKRRIDGRWRVEGKWWKRPGSKGSNVEVVDWTGTANEILTEHAEGVLRAAGRL